MSCEITIFKNMYDTKTKRNLKFDDWDSFKKFIYKLSDIPKKGKRYAELISPAVYKTGTTRANKNVLSWAGWAAVDVDDFEFTGELKDVLYNSFRDWNYIVYSTASSTSDKPKFRIIFELNRYVKADEIRAFWFALQSALDSAGDKQCKDFSRMYYVPAKYAGSHNFIFDNIGDAIDVDSLLLKYPYNERQQSKDFLDRLPEEWQKQILEYKKQSLNNTTYSWTGYKDCPFWPKHMASEYMSIIGSGWYLHMYKMMIALASNAIKHKYPISANEIVNLIREFDRDTGNWYEKRSLDVEANNALEYAYRNTIIEE